MIVNLGVLHDSLARIRMDLLALEHTLSGHFLQGQIAADVRELAGRLTNLTMPRKGHLQPPATACPCDGESSIDPWCAAAGECAREQVIDDAG